MNKIDKLNQVFDENYVNAKMNKDAVIVNCGKIFTETVDSVVNTLNEAGVKTDDYYWNEGLKAFIIPILRITDEYGVDLFE